MKICILPNDNCKGHRKRPNWPVVLIIYGKNGSTAQKNIFLLASFLCTNILGEILPNQLSPLHTLLGTDNIILEDLTFSKKSAADTEPLRNPRILS
jgi:hypothetical protein